MRNSLNVLKLLKLRGLFRPRNLLDQFGACTLLKLLCPVSVPCFLNLLDLCNLLESPDLLKMSIRSPFSVWQCFCSVPFVSRLLCLGSSCHTCTCERITTLLLLADLSKATHLRQLT